MVRSAIVIVSLLGCAAAPAPAPIRVDAPAPARATSSVPPTLAFHTLVEEGETGPSRPELRPYVRQVPLMRIAQHVPWEGSGASFVLVVFADGRAFFEGERHVAEIGFRTRLLGGRERLALIDELERTCPTLSIGPECSPERLTMSCSVRAEDFAGSDECSDDARDHLTAPVAMNAIKTAGLEDWIAPDPHGTESYTASEIDKARRPTSWKKYAPASEVREKHALTSEERAKRRRICIRGKPSLGVDPPHVEGVGAEDARDILAKMHERTEMPVTSIKHRDGEVKVVAECCPIPSPDDCGLLIVRFLKLHGVWTAYDSREIPGE